MRINQFAVLYDKCNSGDPADKYRDLPAFPRIIDLEPSGVCNMRCLMCPTGVQALGRPQGFMSERTWNLIWSECAYRDVALRFIGWGEPLLHPNIVGMIADAHESGIPTHLNTNGTKITSEMANALVNAGLSSIKFSFQGADRESYAAMRRSDFFDGLLSAIGTMNGARASAKTEHPFIAASTSLTDEPPEVVDTFKDRIGWLVDELTIGHTTFDFFDHPKAREIAKHQTVVKRHPDPCPNVFDQLTIHWDGAVRVCCNDFSGVTNLGNVNERSIAEMWRHPDMEAYRERLARKEYTGPICSVCYDYHDLTKGVVV